MRTARWLVVVAGLLLIVSATLADRFVPTRYPGPLGAARHRHSWKRTPYAIDVRLGAPFGYYGPLGSYYGLPYYGTTSYRSLTIITLASPPPPPVIVIQTPPVVIERNGPGPGRDRAELRVPDGPPRPGVPEERRPPLPEKEPLPPPPPEKDRPKEKPPEKEKPKEAPPPRKRDVEPELPRPPLPEDDPRDEHTRLVRAGREAFAEGEYGRAAQRFRQAVRVRPDEPLAYFLLAQALLAGGNYHDAFDAIVAGMRLEPDWPRRRFQPLEMYGRHLDEYTALLPATEKALARHPHDPELLFLRGYVLWFDGRKEEARPFFRRALPGLPNRTLAERFLRALPDAPPL